MSENCTHNCSDCGQSCAERKGATAPAVKSAAGGKVKKVIAVVSGKGGVGKSTTCALLAAMSAKKGYRTAILDADITGPSLPKMFGVHEKARANEKGILPVVTDSGIQTMSMNLLLDGEKDPVLWRGSLIAGAAVQFWTDVLWEDVDYMFVDMPPGTGDVPLSVFQSIPLAGVVMVTTPQDVVRMIVEKAMAMANKMQVPVLGLVENMSYFVCPCCGAKTEPFGQSQVAAIANEYSVPVAARMPLDGTLAALADVGKVEEYTVTEPLEKIFERIERV